MNDVHIQRTANGGTQVFLDGEPLEGVRSVSITGDAQDVPTAEIELYIAEAALLDGKVEWTGIENIPTEALKDELHRRAVKNNEEERRRRAT